MFYKIRTTFNFIMRFIYYGYIGAKYTRDYDASGVHVLINAHLSRVNEFMHDPKKTHLMWNNDFQSRGMRELREVTELSRRVSVDDLGSGFFKAVLNEEVNFNNMFEPDSSKKLIIAAKKDKMVQKGLEDRYWYLLRNKVPGFWD